MTKEEFHNIAFILNNLEAELDLYIREQFTDISSYSDGELGNLYKLINDVRFPSSTIYAAALGVAGRVKNEMDSRRDKKPFVTEEKRKGGRVPIGGLEGIDQSVLLAALKKLNEEG